MVQIISDIRLFEHGIDMAQPIGFGVRHLFESLARLVKIRQCLAVRPPTLRFLRGKDRVIDRLLGVVAPAEMKRQQFREPGFEPPCLD